MKPGLKSDKKPRSSPRQKLSREAGELARFAGCLGASLSRVEDGFWETRLASSIDHLLRKGNEAALQAALDHLYMENAAAFEELADLIEARCESLLQTGPDAGQNIVLIAAPLLAWSRLSIPAGPLERAALQNLRVKLKAHVLAAHSRLALVDFLFSPDQLPRSYVKTFQLVQELAGAVFKESDLHIEPKGLPRAAEYVADARYILGAVAAPQGSPLFRWQEEEGSGEEAFAQWKAQAGPALAGALAGCVYELLPPNAYHSACRRADREGRPFSLKASAAFLQASFNVEAGRLRAVIAPCRRERLEEYRIGFTLADSHQVVYGLVWPLLDAEDENSGLDRVIESLLRECGIALQVTLDERLPLEYCDECGAPLYPNPDGELVHAEWPEDTPAAARLH